MSAPEFIDVDSSVPTGEVMTDEHILKIVHPGSDTDTRHSETALESDGDENERGAPPSLKVARDAMNTVLAYLEASDQTCTEDIDMALKIQGKLHRISLKSMKQPAITDFFQRK